MKVGSVAAFAISSFLLGGPAFAGETAGSDTVQAVIGADGKQRAHIIGGSYFFRPKHIIVKVNVPVELSLRRETGIVPHTFVLKIPEAGVNIDEKLDTDEKVVSFTPTVAGTFDFYCRDRLLFFRSHRERGMEGTLEVVP